MADPPHEAFSQPFDIHIALPSWDDESQRVALFRSNRLSVLTIRDQNIIERLLQRQATTEPASVRASAITHLAAASARLPAAVSFRERPSTRCSSTDRGSSGVGAWPALMLTATIVGTFDEMNARDRGKALYVIHREHKGAFHEPVH